MVNDSGYKRIRKTKEEQQLINKQVQLKLEEAINAATLNGAYAMGLEKTHGSICKGKKANFIITNEIPSYGFIPYSFGNAQIDKVYIEGEEI